MLAVRGQSLYVTANMEKSKGTSRSGGGEGNYLQQILYDIPGRPRSFERSDTGTIINERKVTENGSVRWRICPHFCLSTVDKRDRSLSAVGDDPPRVGSAGLG